MKMVLMMIVAIGGASAAHASGSTSRLVEASRPARAKPSCARSDSEGFCGLTLIHAARTPMTAPTSLNDQGRAQLDRLIASLR